MHAWRFFPPRAVGAVVGLTAFALGFPILTAPPRPPAPTLSAAPQSLPAQAGGTRQAEAGATPQAPAPDFERPEILWRKRAADGREIGLVPRLPSGGQPELNTPRAQPARPGQPPATPGKPAGPPRPDPKLFLGRDTYLGELPAKVRAQVSYVHFAIDGTPHTNPDEGTILNLDGAIVGFRARRDAQTGRGTAELVVLDLAPQGGTAWQGTGVHFLLNPQREFTGAPLLCARLDHKNDSWTLYYRDVIVREDLPLLATEKVPTLSVRPGRESDAAVLVDLRLAAGPPARNPAYVRSVNGRVDLAKAHREGHPLVRAAGERFPGKPTRAGQPGGR